MFRSQLTIFLGFQVNRPDWNRSDNLSRAGVSEHLDLISINTCGSATTEGNWSEPIGRHTWSNHSNNHNYHHPHLSNRDCYRCCCYCCEDQQEKYCYTTTTTNNNNSETVAATRHTCSRPGYCCCSSSIGTVDAIGGRKMKKKRHTADVQLCISAEEDDDGDGDSRGVSDNNGKASDGRTRADDDNDEEKDGIDDDDGNEEDEAADDDSGDGEKDYSSERKHFKFQGFEDREPEIFHHRRQRQQSLPGGIPGRFYDWNTTHFYPDVHEIDVGLTFEAPDSSDFDAERYITQESRGSVPTYISISRSSENLRSDSCSGGDQFFSKIGSKRGSISTLRNAETEAHMKNSYSSTESEKDEYESFNKVWQRSPVIANRHKKREFRPFSADMRHQRPPNERQDISPGHDGEETGVATSNFKSLSKYPPSPEKKRANRNCYSAKDSSLAKSRSFARNPPIPIITTKKVFGTKSRFDDRGGLASQVVQEKNRQVFPPENRQKGYPIRCGGKVSDVKITTSKTLSLENVNANRKENFDNVTVHKYQQTNANSKPRISGNTGDVQGFSNESDTNKQLNKRPPKKLLTSAATISASGGRKAARGGIPIRYTKSVTEVIDTPGKEVIRYPAASGAAFITDEEKLILQDFKKESQNRKREIPKHNQATTEAIDVIGNIQSNLDIVPPDEYVCVVKKVHNRGSGTKQKDENCSAGKQINSKTSSKKCDAAILQQPLLSVENRPKSLALTSASGVDARRTNVKESVLTKKNMAKNSADSIPSQSRQEESVNSSKLGVIHQSSFKQRDPDRVVIRNSNDDKNKKAVKEVASNFSKKTEKQSDRCNYKPPKVPRDCKHASVGSSTDWLFESTYSTKPASYQDDYITSSDFVHPLPESHCTIPAYKVLNANLANSTGNFDQVRTQPIETAHRSHAKTASIAEPNSATTVFGLTGYRKDSPDQPQLKESYKSDPNSNSELYNLHQNPTRTPGRHNLVSQMDRVFESKNSSGLESEWIAKCTPNNSISGHSDLRRRPISSWLDVNNDFASLDDYDYLDRRIFDHSISADNQSFAIDISGTSNDNYVFDSDGYPNQGEAFYGDLTETFSENVDSLESFHRDKRCPEAVELIFNSIEPRNDFCQQNSLGGKNISSLAQRRNKTQDRSEDIVVVDLHTNVHSISGYKTRNDGKITHGSSKSSDQITPTNNLELSRQKYSAKLELAPVTISTAKLAETSQNYITKVNISNGTRQVPTRPDPSSVSVSGSNENFRYISDSDESEDYQLNSVAEIKARLFGPNEEKAKSYLPLDTSRSASLKPDFFKRSSSAARLSYGNSRSMSSNPRLETTSRRNKTYQQNFDNWASSLDMLDYKRIDHEGNDSPQKPDCFLQSSIDNDDDGYIYGRDIEDDRRRLVANSTCSGGQRIHLKEVARDSLSSRARKNQDDMASRRLRCSDYSWSTKSNPDLTQTRNSSKVQTNYPRKLSKTTSKEYIAKTKPDKISSVKSIPYGSADRQNHKATSTSDLDGPNVRVSRSRSFNIKQSEKNYKEGSERRQSLSNGVARLVDLFEKSTSAPNLNKENLFVDSYSESGELMHKRDEKNEEDEEDNVTVTAAFECNNPNIQDRDQFRKTCPNQTPIRCKRDKKTKIRLLKSSDLNYVESETDSICSSCKESLKKDQQRSSPDGGRTEIDRKPNNSRKSVSEKSYDKEKRLQELKQVKEEWLNGYPGASESDSGSFVSKRILPLSSSNNTQSVKIGTEKPRKETTIYQKPVYERSCTVTSVTGTSLGHSAFSAFEKITTFSCGSALSKSTNVASSSGTGTRNQTCSSNRKTPVAKEEPKTTTDSTAAKSLPNKKQTIQIGKPSSFVKPPSTTTKIPIITTAGRQASATTTTVTPRPDKLDLFSDDGNFTDCTDVTIDALLGPNQFSTLSPTSTIDFSDIELCQVTAGLPQLCGDENRQGVSLNTDNEKESLPETKLKSMIPRGDSENRIEKRMSIKELVDSFEVLTTPFAKLRPTLST